MPPQPTSSGNGGGGTASPQTLYSIPLLTTTHHHDGPTSSTSSSSSEGSSSNHHSPYHSSPSTSTSHGRLSPSQIQMSGSPNLSRRSVDSQRRSTEAAGRLSADSSSSSSDARRPTRAPSPSPPAPASGPFRGFRGAGGGGGSSLWPGRGQRSIRAGWEAIALRAQGPSPPDSYTDEDKDMRDEEGSFRDLPDDDDEDGKGRRSDGGSPGVGTAMNGNGYFEWRSPGDRGRWVLGGGKRGISGKAVWSGFKNLSKGAQVAVCAGGTLLFLGLILSSPIPAYLRYRRLPPHTPTSASWPRLAATYRGPPVCDPYTRPGFLSFDEAHPHDTAWIPFDPSCPPVPDYLGALRCIRNVNRTGMGEREREQLLARPRRPDWWTVFQGEGGVSRDGLDAWGRPYPDVTFLKGKLAMLIGDSVDRNALEHLHELLGAKVRGFGYGDVLEPMPPDWDRRNLPWLLNVGLVQEEWEGSWDGGGFMEGMSHPNLKGGDFAGLNFGMVNGFLYGMDDLDEFSAQGDWHAPGLAEDRISQLIAPMAKQLGEVLFDPDFVHSGPHDHVLGPEDRDPTFSSTSGRPSPTPVTTSEGQERERVRKGKHRGLYRRAYDEEGNRRRPRPRQGEDDDGGEEEGEERTEEPLVIRKDRAPAFISLHSGLWDLAFWGRRDRAANLPVDSPLTQEELEWWQGRMRSVVRLLKKTFPDTPIWMRLLHRVGDNFWASHDWNPGLKHGMGEGFVNFFRNDRVHQVRDLELHIARTEGLPVFDLGHVLEGYQKYQDKVHPRREPGGVVFGQAVMHHLYMESIGRENWEEELRRNVGTLPHVVEGEDDD